VEGEALRKLRPEMGGAESGFLTAFDAVRERIHEVADRVYVHGRKGTYTYILVAEDF
jgi:hypothetical protein